MQLALTPPNRSPCTAQTSNIISEQTFTKFKRAVVEYVARTPTCGTNVRVADETSKSLVVENIIRLGSTQATFHTVVSNNKLAHQATAPIEIKSEPRKPDTCFRLQLRHLCNMLLVPCSTSG